MPYAFPETHVGWHMIKLSKGILMQPKQNKSQNNNRMTLVALIIYIGCWVSEHSHLQLLALLSISQQWLLHLPYSFHGHYLAAHGAALLCC
jgi:hypothetical protein